MVARDVERLSAELGALRHGLWEHLGLALLAFGLAVTASQFWPAFAVPLLLGGVASLFLFLRALLRRFELIDRLVLDRDAYAIPEVRRRAEEAATMESRRSLAVSIQCLLRQPALGVPGRVAAVARELEALAAELDDEQLALDPACAVACSRLLNDVLASPLRNPTYPREDVHSRICQILAGFRPRSA